MSPRQASEEFYEQQLRTCLGFGVYYVQNNQIKVINFDIISDCLEEDAHATIRGFRILIEQPFFKQISKYRKDYIIWLDTGKHFRNQFVLGYLLGQEFIKEKIHVNLNFHSDKHGKSPRDQHFSCIAKFVESESLNKKIENSKDVVDAINKGQKQSNENRLILSKAVYF